MIIVYPGNFKPFMHSVEKLANKVYKSCGVYMTRFLKYVLPILTH